MDPLSVVELELPRLPRIQSIPPANKRPKPFGTYILRLHRSPECLKIEYTILTEARYPCPSIPRDRLSEVPYSLLFLCTALTMVWVEARAAPIRARR